MSLWRQILTFMLVLTLFGACIKIGTRSGQLERKAWKLVTTAPLSSLDPSFLNIITLGHRGLYEDFATIWTIQFLAEPTLTNKTNSDEVYAAVDSVTRHHPRFESLYLLSCFTLANDFKRFDLCEKISSDGMIAIPDSYRIPMMMGVLALVDGQDKMKAASYFHLAASAPGSPSYLHSAAEKLAAKGYLDGQDLDESAKMLREIPGGLKIIELMRQQFQHSVQPPTPGVAP